MSHRLAAAVLLVSGLFACKKAPAPAPERSEFEQTWISVRSTPPCSSLIPIHWSMSQPIPALENGKLVYRMFFYGRDGMLKTGFTFYRAQAVATFRPDGSVEECRLTREQKIPIPKEKPDGMTPDQVYRAERELYPLIERLGKLYASGKTPSADEKKDIADLMGKYRPWFAVGQEQDYRELSPDFWKWIDKNGGQAP